MCCMWRAGQISRFPLPTGPFLALVAGSKRYFGGIFTYKGTGFVTNLADLQETKLAAMQFIPRVNQGPEFAKAQATDPTLKPLFQEAASADLQFRMRGGLLYHVAK